MWYENLLERNCVPDFVIRMGIRWMLANKLKIESQGGLEEQTQRQMAFLEELRNSPIALNTQDANEQHYEVPTDFFRYVLGHRMKYSCGLWPDHISSLDASEDAMLDLYAERAELEDGQRILELGCGWGSLSLYLAEKYPNSKITVVSNSKTQKAYIDSQATLLRRSNLEVITADMNDFQPSKNEFDRVLSVEMFEHMRNYDLLIKKCADALKQNGKLFVHIFTHRSFAYPYESKDPNNWMARYFFTGGIMPSQELLSFFQKDLHLQYRWTVNGQHYQKTCEGWLKKMDSQRDRIFPIFESTYGKEQSLKWWVYWRIFFMACAELFGFKKGEEWQVTHYLFKKES